MAKKDIDEKKLEKVLEESEKICNKLNLTLFDNVKGKNMPIEILFYSIARFAAQFLYDIKPAMGDEIVDTFSETVGNIMQAYHDEGKDSTYRVLKYVRGGEN